MGRVVSGPEICELLGVNQTTLRALVTQGLVIRIATGRYDLDASLPKYLAHLRAAASGRGGALADERARLAKSQADLASLKAAALRGDMLDKAAVRDEWLGIARGIRAGVLALPVRVQARLPHLKPDEVAVIEAEARAVLTELADNG